MTGIRRLLVLALLLFAAGCTFERRPGGNGNDGGGAKAAAVEEAGTGSDHSAYRAREALGRLQALRLAGDAAGVRAWMAEDAVVLGGGTEVAWQEAGAPGDSLLAPGGTGEGWSLRVDGRALGEGVLFVLAYPSLGGEGAGPALESLILVPTSGGEWRVRLLHRTPGP